MEANDHEHMDEENDDPVVAEYDVFFHNTLSKSLTLFQYPLRPGWKSYEIRDEDEESMLTFFPACSSYSTSTYRSTHLSFYLLFFNSLHAFLSFIRLSLSLQKGYILKAKPKSRKLEFTFPFPPQQEVDQMVLFLFISFYFVLIHICILFIILFSLSWSSNFSLSSHSHKQVNVLLFLSSHHTQSNWEQRSYTLQGTTLPMNTRYAIAVLSKDGLHLTPLHSIIPLRPSFAHVNAVDENKRRAAEESQPQTTKADTKKEALPVNVWYCFSALHVYTE